MSRSWWMQPIAVCLHCSTDPDKMLFCCQQLDICRWASIPENVLFSRYYAELSCRHLMLLIQHNSTTLQLWQSWISCCQDMFVCLALPAWWHGHFQSVSQSSNYGSSKLMSLFEMLCIYFGNKWQTSIRRSDPWVGKKKTNVYHVCCMDWNVMPCQRVSWDR